MPSTDVDGSAILMLSVAEAAVVKEALDIHHCDFWQPTDPAKAAIARQIIRKIEDVEAYDVPL